MSWIRKSPFSRDEDVTERMVSLLSQEADRSGTPLTEAEQAILSSETESPSEELRQKALRLIGQILKSGLATSSEENPKSFFACLEWVEPDYPNIAALAEEVITSGGFGKLPPSHGQRWVKDRAQLIGCGLLVVLIMFLVVIIWSLISNRK
jgi:hypothetical protein